MLATGASDFFIVQLFVTFRNFNFIWLDFSWKYVCFIANCQAPITANEVRDSSDTHENMACQYIMPNQFNLANVTKL